MRRIQSILSTFSALSLVCFWSGFLVCFAQAKDNSITVEPTVLEHNWGSIKDFNLLIGSWYGESQSGTSINEWWKKTKNGELVGVRVTLTADGNKQTTLMTITPGYLKCGPRAFINTVDRSNCLTSSPVVALVGPLKSQKNTFGFLQISNATPVMSYSRQSAATLAVSSLIGPLSETITVKKID